jgi:hypothetical protein
MDKYKLELVVAEYTSLREEILKRIELRYQLLTIIITAFGAILAFGSQLKSAILIFLYPLLALCSMIIWLSNKYDIGQISSYIKGIESKMGKENLNWESQRALIERQGMERLLSYGSRGFFIITQLLALAIGIVMLTTYPEANNTVADVCAFLAALCFVATLLLLFFDNRRDKRMKMSVYGSVHFPVASASEESSGRADTWH